MEKLLTDDMKKSMTKNEITHFYAAAHRELKNRLDSCHNNVDNFSKELKQVAKRIDRIFNFKTFIENWKRYIPNSVYNYLAARIEEELAFYRQYCIQVNWRVATIEKYYDDLKECCKEVTDYFDLLEI